MVPERAIIETVVGRCLSPGRFFAAAGVQFELEYVEREETPWEVFHGRLLDAAHTRTQAVFAAWNLFVVDAGVRSAEPVLAVKLDDHALHVVRAIHCYAVEGYDAGDNVYLTRETRKWLRELVGTIELADRSPDSLEHELTRLLFQGVIGVSRLPLTSLEAPLPGFVLGRHGYCPRANAGPTPMKSATELIEQALPASRPGTLEIVKLVELMLRTAAAAELESLADAFVPAWRKLDASAQDLVTLFRQLFDEVSLSPWTDWPSRAFRFLRLLEARGVLPYAQRIDFLGYLLRQLGRHLTAYDLVTFHHQGANYPDALLLDALLREFLADCAARAQLFVGGGDEERPPRLRRRALRQALLLRALYEKHAVPDAPTSPGENARVLPAPHVRVPEEQILLPHRRTRLLYDQEPTKDLLRPEHRAALKQMWADLEQDEELRELGTALFLDRPLGDFKPPAEPDRTVLLSYVAFSPSLAERRLRFLHDYLGLDEPASLQRRLARLEGLRMLGVAAPTAQAEPRPGAVTLADVYKVADDFRLLRTTRRSAQDFIVQYGLDRLRLDFLNREGLLIMRGADRGRIFVYDAGGRSRLELRVRGEAGYVMRAGAEYPAGGLEVVRLWNENGVETNLTS